MWGKAFFLFYCIFIVSTVSDGTITIENGHPKHLELHFSRSQTLVSPPKVKRNVKNSETTQKSIIESLDPRLELIKSRRLPTKPIETIITENPAHKSIALENLDIGRTVTRLESRPMDYNNPFDNLGHDAVFSGERVKRSKYYDNAPLKKNNPQVYILQRRRDQYNSEERLKRNYNDQKERTADPNLSNENRENIPVESNTPGEDNRMVVVNIEPVKPPRPIGAVNDRPEPVRVPVKLSYNRPQAYESPVRPPPTPPPEYDRQRYREPSHLTPNPYGATPRVCGMCANHHHDDYHSPERQYYRRRYSDIEGKGPYNTRQDIDTPLTSRSYQHPTYYPRRRNMMANRRFSTGLDRNVKGESRQVTRRIVDYASNDRNQYPLAD